MTQVGSQRKQRRWGRWVVLFLVGLVGGFVVSELRVGRIQATVMSQSVQDARFDLSPGATDGVIYPGDGPFDTRRGYSEIPEILSRLQARGGEIIAQSAWTQRMRDIVELGLSPPYPEKALAGLEVRGRRGEVLYDAVDPHDRAFDDLAEVPAVVGETLMFFENRELLDDQSPYKNPAFELKRTLFALSQAARRVVDPGVKVPGGSTLATQLEKFRHSDGGLTRTPTDKLRQMLSASLRAYATGVDTMAHRQQVLVDYLNSFPLGAVPGYGEVHGLASGLWAWFGMDIDDLAPLLEDVRAVTADDPQIQARAEALAHTVALLIATRRPNALLGEDRDVLDARMDFELGQMAEVGLISRPLALAAQRVTLRPAESRLPRPPLRAEAKGAGAVRRTLREALGKGDYDLDRMDLAVDATLDVAVQQAATEFLQALRTPAGVEAIGLRRFPGGADPSQVHYSLTLYERRGGANRLRVHAETAPGQFSYNDSMKLELGSTAKLRTLVSWLSAIADMRQRFQAEGVPRRWDLHRLDHLGRWVAQWMRRCDDACTEDDLMAAALDRTFSASPHAWFFTGGGRHRFHNFKESSDRRVPTVREALAKSINLPFVRIMEELIHHMTYSDGAAQAMLDDPEHPDRQRHLDSFVMREGEVFLSRYWRRHRDLDVAASLDALAESSGGTPAALAVIFRSVRPEAPQADLDAFLDAHLSTRKRRRLDADDRADLYARHAIDAFDLQDRGYIASVHPLELWVARWIVSHPEGEWADMLAESEGPVREAYRWLYEDKQQRAQKNRIKQSLERETFARLHAQWVKLGFPFDALVPSYATALGSSGDRPEALATLAGILSAEGVRYPMRRVNRIWLAKDTPYAAVVDFPGVEGERVLRPAVARAALKAMRGVVKRGTGRALKGAFGGKSLMVRAKTGTGDNRSRKMTKWGKVISETVHSRTATVVFTLGDRWFGAMTAVVMGPEAGEHEFTSGLVSRSLARMAPILLPALRTGLTDNDNVVTAARP